MNKQGIQSYCQECGACNASLDSNSCMNHEASNIDPQLLEIIIDEVVRNVSFAPVTKTFKENPSSLPTIPLGVSNRHIHLTRQTFEKLFGIGKEPEIYRELYQPKEFASKQLLSIAGPKMRTIQNVRILGPLRKYDQVEISLTDAIFLGIKAPVKNSGDLSGAAPLTLIGPEGSVFLKSCAIIASRHIHMTSRDAANFGVQEGDFCKVRIGGIKGLVFENVLIRVNDDWKLQLHLDTDDANAANVRCQTLVEFVGKM